MNEQIEIDGTARSQCGAKIAVIGGGLSGLVAAITAAGQGAEVQLFEGAKSLGGRALTSTHKGFYFNMGPHALYANGAACRIFRELGIEPDGKMPSLEGHAAIYGGKKYLLPVSAKTILKTRYLGLRDKFEIFKFYGALAKLDTAQYRFVTQRDMIDAMCKRPKARLFLEAACRLATYCNAPNLVSAEVSLNQLRLGGGGVYYLHSGWGTLVGMLEAKAKALGVKIMCGEKLRSVDKVEAGQRLQFASGNEAVVGAVILCVPPKQVTSMGVGTPDFKKKIESAVEVHAACLDIAIAKLPEAKATFALGMDEPSYFSVHSATAHLAPTGGGLAHAAFYLAPDHKAAVDEEAQLEALVSKLQPLWQSTVVHRIFRPQALVSYWLPQAHNGGLQGRPEERASEGMFIAGDWVGAEGILSDAAVASGQRAARAAVKYIQPVK